MQRRTTSLLFLILFSALIVSGQRPLESTYADSKSGSPVRLNLPNKEGNVRFVVIGDTGTGTKQQRTRTSDASLLGVFPFRFCADAWRQHVRWRKGGGLQG